MHRILAVAVTMLMLASPMALASNGGGPALETITGQVHDEHGVPAEGVLVRIEGVSLGAPTDEKGRYLLTGHDLDGPGVVTFSAEGYMTVRIKYDLEDGGTLESSVYLVEVEVVPGSVEGTVLSFDGTPIEGALVTLSGSGLSTKAVLTDADGHYSITDVPPSTTRYLISVEAVGHETRQMEVLVDPDNASRVDMTLASETSMELIHGKVTDSRGLPLPGVTVIIDGSLAEWTTDMNGQFSALLDGRMGLRNVSLSLPGYDGVQRPVNIPDPGVTIADLQMTVGEGGGPETLWVQVLSSTNEEPVGDATVTISGRQTTWTTDSQGVAMVTGTDLEGDLTVIVSKTSHTSASEDFSLEDGGTGVVTMQVTRSSNAVTLTGDVKGDSSGEPIIDAKVVINSGGIVWLTISDINGAFKVHNLPPSIPTTITVMSQGYSTVEVDTVLEEYSGNHIIITMEATTPTTATVVGTITAGGELVKGAKVTMWTTTFHSVTWTDASGGYSMESVPVSAGWLDYRVEHQYHAVIDGRTDLPAKGGLVTLNLDTGPIELPFTVVKGIVSDPDGFAIDGARVQLATGWETLETQTSQGMYEIYLPLKSDMDVDVSSTAAGYGRATQSAILQEQSVKWVNLTLALGPDHGNVIGQVLADGRRPVEGAEVHLSYGGAYHKIALTGTDGAFAFLLVPETDEPYTLSAVVEGYDGTSIEVFPEGGWTINRKLMVTEDVTSVEIIQGIVTSNEGLPMANAVVRVGGTNTILTDANGSYILVSEDLEGRWSISASFSGFETTHQIVELLPGGTKTVDMTLDVMDAQATSVSGRVQRASDGKPMTDVRVRLGWSGSSSWTFEATTGNNGEFTFHGVPMAWGGVIVTVTAEGYHDRVVPTLLSESEGTWLEFYMQSVVTPEPDEPVMTETEARRIGAGVSITIGALAIILMTEVGRVALLGLILVPLYTKIKREKVMDHFVRGRIYEFVCQNPGVNYSAIKEQFKLTNGTVTYHLSMLERQEFIRAKQDGIYKRYFPNNGGPSPSDVEPMSLQLSIARAIRKRPGMTQKEISKHLRSSKQLVSYHIRRMKKDGQLETRRDGRSVRVYPNHLTPE
jgi:predicted transcriptional regulator